MYQVQEQLVLLEQVALVEYVLLVYRIEARLALLELLVLGPGPGQILVGICICLLYSDHMATK